MTNVISWLDQVGYNELKFVISEAWGEPAELSTLFEHERTNAHATQSTLSFHCEGLVALMLSPLATYYIPTTCRITYWEMASRTPSPSSSTLYEHVLMNETPYITNSFGIFTELQI